MEAVLEYITSNDRCRSQMLLKYFGEKNAPRCGRCDICLERNKMNLNEMEFEQIKSKVKELLQDRSMTLAEMVYESGSFGESHLLMVVRWLEDKGAIERDEQMRYAWRKQFRLKI
jgi:ATP-dependent DNA helicase RecQ